MPPPPPPPEPPLPPPRSEPDVDPRSLPLDAAVDLLLLDDGRLGVLLRTREVIARIPPDPVLIPAVEPTSPETLPLLDVKPLPLLVELPPPLLPAFDCTTWFAPLRLPPLRKPPSRPPPPRLPRNWGAIRDAYRSARVVPVSRRVLTTAPCPAVAVRIVGATAPAPACDAAERVLRQTRYPPKDATTIASRTQMRVRRGLGPAGRTGTGATTGAGRSGARWGAGAPLIWGCIKNLSYRAPARIRPVPGDSSWLAKR
jgi:hypothetical protein